MHESFEATSYVCLRSLRLPRPQAIETCCAFKDIDDEELGGGCALCAYVLCMEAFRACNDK